jgi:hypothetical protein
MDGAEMHQALHTAVPAGFNDVAGAFDIDLSTARPVVHRKRNMGGQVIHHPDAAEGRKQRVDIGHISPAIFNRETFKPQVAGM